MTESQQPITTVEHERYPQMERVTEEDYRAFVAEKKTVEIENVTVEVGRDWHIKEFAPPKEYKAEEFTVWSFPNRGDWATHSGNYRGNWSPYIPRNLIMKFTNVGDIVLDQMCGSGTTLVECKLLSRNGIGIDINRDAVMVAKDRLNFPYATLDEPKDSKISLYIGDARNLNLVENESVDLIATHPPYAGIIAYSGRRIEDDLSCLPLAKYLTAMTQVAAESHRVLKKGKYCAVLIGDTRKGRHYVPISLGVLQAFLRNGFVLKEDIIKLQHKTMTTRQKWRGHNYDFYKIAHEHLYIFRKSSDQSERSKLKFSSDWWFRRANSP